MTTTDLSFGKIASTPTKSAWSQAYNAGGLFVILALSLQEPESEHESLGIIGKNFLNDLEAEFFPLEEKNTVGIGRALEKVVSEVPKSVDLTTVVAFHKDGTLYLFLVGNGSIILKRGEDLGVILAQSEAESRTLKSASGYLDPSDTVLLASVAFKKALSDETIKSALSCEDIDEAVEMLTLHAQRGEDGSICALIFRHKENADETIGMSSSETEPDETDTEENYIAEDPPVPDKPLDQPIINPPYSPPPVNTISDVLPENKTGKFSLPATFSALSHRRKVILSVALIIIVVLAISVFFTINTQQAKERAELFSSFYPEALKDYEEAEGLLDLNKALAREELEKALELLAKGDDKFPQDSEEFKKTAELQAKVDSLLDEVGQAKAVTANEISKDESQILAALISSGRIAAVEDDTSVYFLTDKEINSIRKGSKSEQTLVENDNDWEDPVGLGKFGSNFYILDRKKGVLKLVPSGTDYNVSNYLVGDVSVADSSSMTNDTSIYVLYKNGEVKKFTRGKQDSFSLSGLENPLKNPTQIVTTEDIDNIYILDPSTARIVKIKKDGSFSEEYQTQILQIAKAIAVAKDESKAYILSGGKLYEISL